MLLIWGIVLATLGGFLLLVQNLVSSPTETDARKKHRVKYVSLIKEIKNNVALVVADEDADGTYEVIGIPEHKWVLGKNNIETIIRNKNGADNDDTDESTVIETESSSSEEETVKPVRVALLTYGTRGDIQPMIALALAMKKIHKSMHKESNFKKEDFTSSSNSNNFILNPFICAPDVYKGFIEGYGVEFVSAGIQNVEQNEKLFKSDKVEFADVVDEIQKVYKYLSKGFLNACSAEGGCDFIITQVFSKLFGMHIAEKLKIPCWVAHFGPSDTPTFDFPPPEYKASNYGVLNKLSYHWRGLQIVLAAKKCGLIDSDEHFRETVLGLPKLSLDETIEREKFTPNLHAYSAILQPKPRDWASWQMMTGPWRLPSSSLGPEIEKVSRNECLMAFLAKQPIFITYGSMEHVDDILLKTLDAVSKLNMPILVCAKPELTAALGKKNVFDDSKIHFTYAIPFDFVFQKCCCIVHHGGAGTTASAAYAGIPSVVIPILQWSDQQYWARIVSDKRIGIHLPLAKASVSAIRAAVTSAMTLANQTKLVAEILNRQADGAHQAARLVFEYLRVQ